MANGTFKPQANPFLETMQNLFQSPQQQFSDVVGKPQARPLTAPDLLTQLKGRFQNAEQMSQLKSAIGDYGKLAAGEQGYEEMPAATQAATPALEPVAQNATAAAPVAATVSPYAYQSMAQEQRDMMIDDLLRSMKADMSSYEGEEPRSKYQDILGYFATDGGPTKYGWNTNIYNRLGLPDEYYQNFIIPYLTENAPMGSWPYQTKMLVNAIDLGADKDAGYGQMYDVNKEIIRQGILSKNASNNALGSGIAKGALSLLGNYVAPGLGAAMNLGLSGLENSQGGKGWSGALEGILNNLPAAALSMVPYLDKILGVSVPIAGPSGGGEIATSTMSQELGHLAEAAPVLGMHNITGPTALTYGSPEFIQMGEELGLTPEQTMSLKDTSLGGVSALGMHNITGPTALTYGSPEFIQKGKELGLTPEQTMSLKDTSLGGVSAESLAAEPKISMNTMEIIKNPVARKLLNEMIGKLRGEGRDVDLEAIPYIMANKGSNAAETAPLEGGALTMRQNESDKAADPNAILGSSAPFMSAAQKMAQKKNAAQILSKLRAAMREA